MSIETTVTLFEQIEGELIEALTPLLRPADADGLKQIEVQAFGSAEEIATLLENFRSRIPGAFLSIPNVTYDTSTDIRAADFTLEYSFLVGVENVRSTTDRRKRAAYYFHDQLHRQIFYKRIVNCEIPANLDFIRPTRFEVATVDNMTATLTSFSIKVRNWQIRELER